MYRLSAKVGTRAEIGLDDTGIGADRRRAAGGDDAAALEADDATGERHEKRHVVLDDEEGETLLRQGGEAPRQIVRIVPASARWTPAIRLSSVVLPELFGPMTPVISPRATARSTPASATTPPKFFFSPLTASTGSAAGVGRGGKTAVGGGTQGGSGKSVARNHSITPMAPDGASTMTASSTSP